MENPLYVAKTFHGRARAEEYALVILAMELPYWIVEEEGLFHLCIRLEDAEQILPELALYDQERATQKEERRKIRKAEFQPYSLLSLPFFIAILLLFYYLQLTNGSEWLIRGRADSSAILQGEWRRTLTALTLHGDFGHLLANLTAGTLFAVGLFPLLGVGWTWFGMVLGGALGNLLNAWGHRGETHLSIGASTAVFAGLGMLIAWQTLDALRRAPRSHRKRETFIPLATGIALLAFLGTGGGEEWSRIDTMAHLLGMLAGGGIGTLLNLFELPKRTPPLAQGLLSLLAVALLVIGWLLNQ